MKQPDTPIRPTAKRKRKVGIRRDNAIFGTTDRDWIQLSFHRRHFAQNNRWNMHFDDVRELMGLAAGTSKGCDMVLEILGEIEKELRRVQDFLRDERSRYFTSEMAKHFSKKQ